MNDSQVPELKFSSFIYKTRDTRSMISHVKYLCGLKNSMIAAPLISTETPSVCNSSTTRFMGLLGGQLIFFLK